MHIGNYDVDRKLFQMYVRAIIAIRNSPFEECYEQSRWDIHCRILESVGLRQGGAAYNDSPSRMQTPTRKSVATSDNHPEPFMPRKPAEVEAFNDALHAEADLYLKHGE